MKESGAKNQITNEDVIDLSSTVPHFLFLPINECLNNPDEFIVIGVHHRNLIDLEIIVLVSNLEFEKFKSGKSSSLVKSSGLRSNFELWRNSSSWCST